MQSKLVISGPKLPNGAVLVPYDNTVVAVGGSKESGTYGNTIFKLTCPNIMMPTSECEWIELEQKLSNGRNYPVAMMIHDRFTSCIPAENMFYQYLINRMSSFLVS